MGAQKRWVFETAMDGHFWGTITSEPGSGGDFLRTKATATAVEGIVGRYHIYGAKHFGSGAQLVSYMITTAKPDGADLPLAFYLDLRDQPWDGTAGLSITRPWDGMGMKATQSHAVMLEGIEGIVFAWPDALEQVATVVGTLGLAMFTGVIAAIVDSAMSEAETRLSGRPLRSYEDVEWTHAQIEHWMLVQARNGLTNTVATTDPAAAALATVKAKMGIATLAESILGRLSRAVGGSAFSSTSPFACWNEDVRALGYLRPPWALAFDQLSAAREPVDPPSAHDDT